MRRAVLLLPALLLAAFAPAVPAAGPEPGLAVLEAFLDRVRTLTADFRQETVDADGQVVETARGELALQRPGRFRWDYREPFERLVLADGERLWLYEADLEQVTVRALGAGLGETPAALLTGERSALERFELVTSWRGEDLAWVRLAPRSADADFESVAIGFAGTTPVRFELADRLGQQTRIVFSDVKLNPALPDSRFRFEPPPGVDVIREGVP